MISVISEILREEDKKDTLDQLIDQMSRTNSTALSEGHHHRRLATIRTPLKRQCR
ncbi:hypothetical protein J6590_076481 [Homalodisca vitripennis]|nr:hypothetical protein J6590_076481 [Homalodisca vitripennis]